MKNWNEDQPEGPAPRDYTLREAWAYLDADGRRRLWILLAVIGVALLIIFGLGFWLA